MPALRSTASVWTVSRTFRHVGSVLIDMWRSVKTTHSHGASKAGAMDGAGTFSMSWRADFDRFAAAVVSVQYCRESARRRDVLWCRRALPRINGMVGKRRHLCGLQCCLLPLQVCVMVDA